MLQIRTHQFFGFFLRVSTVFMFLVGTLCGQTKKIDSLKSVLEFTSPSNTLQKAFILLRLSEEEQGEPIRSISYAQRALEIAQKIGDSSAMCESLNWIAYSHNEQGKYNDAFNAAKNSLAISSKIKNSIERGRSLTNLGTTYWRKGNFDEALEYLFQALLLQEEIRDTNTLLLTLNRIGSVYKSNEQYSRAEEYYQKAYILAQKVNDIRRQATQLNNLGDNLLQQHDNINAVHYFLQALEINLRIGNKRQMAVNYTNLGEAYIRLGNLDSAHSALRTAQNLWLKLLIFDNLAFVFIKLSELAVIEHQLDSAINFANIGYTIADSIGARPYKRDALKALSEASLLKKDTSSAYIFLKKYLVLKDSLVNDENRKKSLFRQAQFTIDTKEKEIELLKKDSEKQALVRNFLLIATLFSVIILALTINRYIFRKKSEQMLQKQRNLLEEQSATIQETNTTLQEQLETLRRTQTQLAQAEKMASLGTLVAGVAHELNTPIGVAVTAASTLDVRTKDFVKRYQEGGLKKSELDAYVQTAQMGADLTLRNLERAANLIQSFKQVAVDQTTDNKRRIGVKSYIAGIITSLEPKWKTTRHRVELVCDETLEMETYPGAIAQIITNLIDNSLLHGFQGYTEEGIMRIKVENQDPNNQVTITYSDNGKGIPPEVLPRIFDPFFTTKQAQGGTGLGMHIVYNLVTQKLRGEISCHSDNYGTTFTLIFANSL
jgi:signal transduction histidine kinase/Flp pilus assembly protein TadD